MRTERLVTAVWPSFLALLEALLPFCVSLEPSVASAHSYRSVHHSNPVYDEGLNEKLVLRRSLLLLFFV